MVAIPAEKAQVQLRGRLWVRRLDGLLVGLILLLAFLAASFSVRNGDFWFHLATGRLLVPPQPHQITEFADRLVALRYLNRMRKANRAIHP